MPRNKHSTQMKENTVNDTSRLWACARGLTLPIAKRGLVMGIVNVTPDSFSDGGQFRQVDAAVTHALTLIEQGADIVDIGGESTRPGALPVSAAEEQDRVLPVIEQLSRETQAAISVDTYRAETARLALAAGAHIVNDVYGLQKDEDMATVVADAGAGVCVMYTSRERDLASPDILADRTAFFTRSLAIADAAGIARQAITLDPGFGFNREPGQDVELLSRFAAMETFGLPVLAGTSRKRFIGALTGRDVASERDAGTLATTVLLRLTGAAIFRVHNVTATRDALAVVDAL